MYTSNTVICFLKTWLVLDHRHTYLYFFGRFTQGSGIIIVRGGFIFVNFVDDLHVHPNEPQTWFLHFSYYMYTSNRYLSYWVDYKWNKISTNQKIFYFYYTNDKQ